MKPTQAILDWLLAGDPALSRLTALQLLGETRPTTEDGLIDQLLSAFDPNTGLWGGGVYSPKWISTHYTLLDLKSLGIRPNHPLFQRGLATLLDAYWPIQGPQPMGVGQDLCVLGMAVGLLSYGHQDDSRLEEMVAYLLQHTQGDGGWNCEWNRKGHASKKSSLHTTLTVLEAFQDYLDAGYTQHAEAIRQALPLAQHFILKKKLYLSESSGQPIHKDFMSAHFPTRWKYDYLRALVYFAQINYPLEPSLYPALGLLSQQLKKGPQPGLMPKGTTYTGRVHLAFEAPGVGGRFNTLRAYRVLAVYGADFNSCQPSKS